jgi:trigger factor
VREHDVDVIAAPEVEITNGREEGPVSFEATVEIRPKVLVPGYASLRVEVPSPAPTEEEIDEQLDRMRQPYAKLEDVEREAQQGDVVSIDLFGHREGEGLPGLEASGYLYEVGKNSLGIIELDNHLDGASAGDEIEFTAAHPNPNEEPFELRVKVNEVKEKILPELDDAWAQEASEFETFDELRADVVKRMTVVRALQSSMALRERAAEALGDLVDDEIPEALTNVEMRNRLNDLLMRLQAQGVGLEQYLAATGKDQAEFAEELKAGAERAVRIDLALRAVADAEDIDVDDSEIDAEIEGVAARVRRKPAQVRKDLERNDQIPAVRSDLRKRKALEWLVERVEIVDPEGHEIDRAALTPGVLAADDSSDTQGSSDAAGTEPDDQVSNLPAEPASPGEPSTE